MLPWMSLLLACEREEEPLPSEPSDPHLLASLTLEGVGHNLLNQIWLQLGALGPRDDEAELESCQPGGFEGQNPRMDDAGELNVRVGFHSFTTDHFLANDGVVDLGEDYPVGFPVAFSATGGSALPAFQVPELVVVPTPTEELSARWEGDAWRFEWTPAVDDVDTLLVLLPGSGQPGVTCRVEDDGSFVVSADELAELGLDEVNAKWLVRNRTRQLVQGDVLVRGTARHISFF